METQRKLPFTTLVPRRVAIHTRKGGEIHCEMIFRDDQGITVYEDDRNFIKAAVVAVASFYPWTSIQSLSWIVELPT